MIATLCLLVAIQSKPITLNYEVGRADKAVAALSQVAGIPMKAVGETATEVVFLKVDNLPLSDVMKSLAKVTGAEWEHKNDGSYVLAQSVGKVQAEETIATQVRLVRLNAWRANLVKCLEIPYDDRSLTELVKERSDIEAQQQGDEEISEVQREKNQERYHQLEYVDPVYRALARCLIGLDMGLLANLAPQTCLVFSSDPNRVQLPLTSNAALAMRNLQAEQAVWGKALRTKPLHAGEELESRFSTDSTINFFKDSDSSVLFEAQTEAWGRTLPFRGTPALALLTATCYYVGGYHLNLTLISEQGDPVMNFSLSDIDLPETAEPKKEELPKIPSPKPSPETVALWNRGLGSGAEVKPAIATLKRFFDDPVNHDSLWIGNQERLSAIAEYKKKSLIACLPDEVQITYGREYERADLKLDPADLLQSECLGKSESADLLELYPAQFTQHWIRRSDRLAMAACVKSYRESGQIDLLTYVKLVYRSNDYSVGGDFVQLVDPDYRPNYGSFDMPSQQAFGSLLAGLSTDQLARLKKGETIPYKDLTPAQIRLAAAIVYGGRMNSHEEGTAPNQLLQLSPTLELPNGVLDGGGLSGEFGTDQIAIFHNGVDGKNDGFFSENVSNGDRIRFWSGPPPRVPPGGMAAATVTLHDQKYITLRCSLTPKHFMVGRFAAPEGKAKDKPVLINKLPHDIQTKLAGAIEFLSGMHGFGHTEPPPPL